MNVLSLLGAVALAGSWLMPGHYFPWLTFQQELAACIGAGLLVWGCWLKAGATHFNVPPLAIASSLIAVVPLTQFAAGQVNFASDAILSAAYVLGFGLCAAAPAVLSPKDRSETLVLLLLSLTIAAAVSVCFAFMQWQGLFIGAFVDGAAPGGRYYANFGQPNNLSTALLLGICGALLGYERQLIGAVASSAIVGFLGLGLVMTQSRTGWISVLLLSLWLMFKRTEVGLRVRQPAILVALGGFFLASLSWAPLNELLLMQSQETALHRATSGGLRWTHWQVIGDAIARRPWFGYGWNQTVLAQQEAVVNHAATGEVLMYAHNFLLDLLVWNGVPIGSILILGLVWWFIRQVKRAHDAEAVIVLGAISVVIIHGLLEFPLAYAFFLLPLGFLMGALDGRFTGGGRKIVVSRLTMVVPTAALTALIALVAVEYIEVDEKARVMRFVVMGMGIDKVSVAPEPDVRLLDRPRELHRFMMTRAVVSQDPAYLEQVRRIAMLHPMAPAMMRYAMAAGLNGHPDESALVLRRLCKMHSAERCDEGRASWSLIGNQYPSLHEIPYPATPVELPLYADRRPSVTLEP